MKPIKTIDGFMKTYFPKEYLKQKLAKMSPKELGKYWAMESIKRLKKGG